MNEHDHTLLVDSNTVASNPGQIKIEALRWLRYRPLWPVIWLALFVFTAVLAIKFHWAYAILATLFLAINWFYWRRLKEHFLVGCANAAMVINLSPLRMAVYTDLRCSYSAPECPTVKIIQTRLPKKPTGKYAIGDKILTVSLYSGQLERDRWLSFDPIPASQVTNNQMAIENLKSDLTDEWESLEAWYAKVPDPKKSGLYAFDQGNDIPRGETQNPPEKPKSPWEQPKT